MPGAPDVVASIVDPAFLTTNTASAFFSGGFRWFNNTTGGFTKGYTAYVTTRPNDTFGKANGLGDVVALSDPAPIEIGNRVFRDNDGDGIQDANEPGIADVTVQLFRGGVQVGTTTTAADGTYLFNAANVTGGVLPNTAYEVRIATGQAALAGLALALADRGGNDAIDSDATAVGGNAVIALTTGGPRQNSHTFDAGFSVFLSASLAGFVYSDADNDGVFDAGEAPIPGATVTLTGHRRPGQPRHHPDDHRRM